MIPGASRPGLWRFGIPRLIPSEGSRPEPRRRSRLALRDFLRRPADLGAAGADVHDRARLGVAGPLGALRPRSGPGRARHRRRGRPRRPVGTVRRAKQREGRELLAPPVFPRRRSPVVELSQASFPFVGIRAIGPVGELTGHNGSRRAGVRPAIASRRQQSTTDRQLRRTPYFPRASSLRHWFRHYPVERGTRA